MAAPTAASPDDLARRRAGCRPFPAVRMPPKLPSRREVRLVRQLGANAGERASAGNDAGWYQDPEDAGQLRWWDGVGWSERTYPSQPALA